MASLKQKKVADAGVITPAQISQELNDGTVGQSYSTAPKSSYAISETNVLVFTDTKIVGKDMVHTNIADSGAVRPGTTA